MNNKPGVYFSLYCFVFQNKSVIGTRVCFGNWEFQLAMLQRGSPSKLHFYFNVLKSYVTNKSHQSVSSHRAASSGDRLSHSNDRAARLRVVCPSFLFVFIFDRSHFQKALTVDQSMCLQFQVLTIFSHSFRVNHCSSFSGSGCLSTALQRHYALFTTYIKSYIRTTTFFFLTTLLGNITQDNNMGLKTFFFHSVS